MSTAEASHDVLVTIMICVIMWFEGPFTYQAWERTEVDIEEEDAEDEDAEEEEVEHTEEEEVSNKLSGSFDFCY